MSYLVDVLNCSIRLIEPFLLLLERISQSLHLTRDLVRVSRSILGILQKLISCKQNQRKQVSCMEFGKLALYIAQTHIQVYPIHSSGVAVVRPRAYPILNITTCSSEGILLGCCGFHGDALTVTKNIKAQMKVRLCHKYCGSLCLTLWSDL